MYELVACVASFPAAALTFHAVSCRSEHFDAYKGSSGVKLAGLWSDVYGSVLPCAISATASSFSDISNFKPDYTCIRKWKICCQSSPVPCLLNLLMEGL